MKGLIKKDLLMIKGNLKYALLFLVVFIIISLEDVSVIYYIPTFISMMIFITTFSYDEYNSWDAYAISMPVSRKDIVKSKYIASIILIFIAVIFTIIISLIIGLIYNNINFQEIIANVLICAASIIILEAIMFPLIYKFGVEKGRIGIFVGIFGMALLIGFLLKNFNVDANNFIVFFDKYYYLIIPITLIIVLVISYLISKKIYLKKEF